MERKRNSLSLEAFQIFIEIEGESIVYDFIAFAILQGIGGRGRNLVLNLKMGMHFTEYLQSGF